MLVHLLHCSAEDWTFTFDLGIWIFFHFLQKKKKKGNCLWVRNPPHWLLKVFSKGIDIVMAIGSNSSYNRDLNSGLLVCKSMVLSTLLWTVLHTVYFECEAWDRKTIIDIAFKTNLWIFCLFFVCAGNSESAQGWTQRRRPWWRQWVLWCCRWASFHDHSQTAARQHQQTPQVIRWSEMISCLTYRVAQKEQAAETSNLNDIIN